MRYYILMAMMLLLGAGSAKASAYDDTSVAGLFPVNNQGREVWNFNPNWRFHLGDVLGAERADYDDTSWGVVSTPHSVKLEPAEASGCRNYQGIAWYRKTFIVPGNRSEIYFEAIMGKQKIYVNGKLAKEHFGGYLPVIVNLKEQGLKKGDKCVVAVMADNSNDKSYPPGKPQYTLDFAYHGGIYRDVWLINKKEISITNVIEADRRDAGIFVHFSDISEKQAKVFVDVDLQNVGGKARKVKVEQSLLDASGKVLKTISQNVLLAAGDAHQTVRQMFSVRNPHLWSPETPYLYSVVTRIKDGKQVLDGGKTKLGIRSFEFRGKEGFWLNGKKYRQFIGANRHQDFAYVGNALPNSQQWRDVLRLKNAGFNIIRTAHYPQDPSFMDACDELGIFIIVATPGWQYWNKDPQFAERVFQNTREIIRRDRNHPSVLMWEPILNETRYPKDFALKSLQLTKDGKVVCTDQRMPSRRSTKLRLYVDEMGKPLVADGSDFVVVVAEVTDDNGHVRRLAKENIRFTLEGEGEIIGDASINANPRAVEWGSAPILVRSTMKPGKIKIHAEVQFPGTHAPTPADLEIESVAYQGTMMMGTKTAKSATSSSVQNASSATSSSSHEFTPEQKAKMLKEVEDQQADFGINN